MGQALRNTSMVIASRLADAVRGDIEAYYDLGIAFSSGSDGVDVDLVEAHKWFNLAAVGGNSAGQVCRAEIAHEMSTRQIAEAQRQARTWLRGGANAGVHAHA
ncbi:sel1 repeat family protein [Sphingomonas solaris]|uniref:Sel1 repeat family protein n=1 Tax=Alterirhizorhabdus solaris TaxID=2529389 RepID=A0A558R9U5_9SPHN|nr:sel1 repeat family protein [Sphingomonas solaris]TVV76151.1 sel1 repeat family protein [Sphingomonas solaris]